MEILKANYNDLTHILSLQKLAYLSEAKLLNNFSIQPLIQTIDELKTEYNSGIILKATTEPDSNAIIGSVRGFSKDNTLFIGKLIVRPDSQRKGIGKALLNAIENYFPNYRYELFTSSKSINNIVLYKKSGYSEFKREKVNDELEFVFLEKFIDKPSNISL